jgi:hypothetical protein
MAFNGTGTFNRLYSWVVDATNGLFVSSTRMDAEMDGMATAFNNCMTRDGQSPATANIPMGSNRITGLANGVAPTDAAAVGQVRAGYTYAGFVGQPIAFSGSAVYTAATITSKSDPLSEITIGAGGTFVPAVTGSYEFSGSVWVQSLGTETAMFGSTGKAVIHINGIQGSENTAWSWPFANNVSRIMMIPYYTIASLTAGAAITFRVQQTYGAGGAPLFAFHCGIHRIS